MINLPTSDIEKQEILKEVIKNFEKDKEYSSLEVTEILSKLDVEDPVLFRRELSNFGYLKQDPYKNKYLVKKYELSKEELEKVKDRYKDVREVI